jgi:hypothetical protein
LSAFWHPRAFIFQVVSRKETGKFIGMFLAVLLGRESVRFFLEMAALKRERNVCLREIISGIKLVKTF